MKPDPNLTASELLAKWDAFNQSTDATNARRKSINGCLKAMRDPLLRAAIVQMSTCSHRAVEGDDAMRKEFFATFSESPTHMKGMALLICYMSMFCAALLSEDPECRKGSE